MITKITYQVDHQHSTDFVDYFNLYEDKEIIRLETSCGCSDAEMTNEGIKFQTSYSKFQQPQLVLPNYSEDNNSYTKSYTLKIYYKDNTATLVTYKIKVSDGNY